MFFVGLGLLIGLPVAALLAAGFPLTFNMPQAGRFNITGGIEILPEFVALLLGLVTYTAAFIAEVVRAGILAVSRRADRGGVCARIAAGTDFAAHRGAAGDAGHHPAADQSVPQSDQELFACGGVGYPDLVQIFTGTVLNQTGQAVEVVFDHDGGLSDDQPRHVDG